MDLGLDNLQDLIIDSTFRPHIVEEYSLRELAIMKNTNITQIGNLIKFLSFYLDNVQSEQLRTVLAKKREGLYKCFSSNASFNPKDYYRTSSAYDFSEECFDICQFGYITDLLTDLHNYKKWAVTHAPNDVEFLKKLDEYSKNVCMHLGIRTPSLSDLQNAYMHPDSDLAFELGINVNVVDENDLKHDIELWSIPYYVAIPEFDKKDRVYNYRYWTINDASAFYNRRKYDELVEPNRDSAYKR